MLLLSVLVHLQNYTWYSPLKDCSKQLQKFMIYICKSQYFDNHLQPHVQELGSYVKDSTDFIKKISAIGKVLQERFLVTMDVFSLYTNTPNSERIKGIEARLKQKNLQTKAIISFMKLILTLNNFIFHCRMCNGDRMRPNIRERLYWVYLTEQKVQLYLRYINDIFFIWTGFGNELQPFISKISQVNASIKFDFNCSKTQSIFLKHNSKKIYRKTFNNTIQKRSRPAILSPPKIGAP